MGLGRVYRAIVFFGVVSLLGDMVYEGARGVVPSYLRFLGASALIVGLAGGVGEFLGYGFRLVGGYLADATGMYWAFIFLGYGLLVVVPLLGAAWSWPVAVGLVLAERMAKGLRSPARDTVLSAVSSSVGYGKAFGLHELLDQVGAVAGPGLVAVVVAASGFKAAFAVLAVPYAALMLVLYAAYRYVGTMPGGRPGGGGGARLPRVFWLYSSAVLFNTLGLMHVSLLLYRFSRYAAAWAASTAYLAAMGVDAAAAPLAGLAYDRIGLPVLFIPFALSVAPSLLGLMGGEAYLAAGIVLFGVILGLQESVYRAAVASMTPRRGRGAAYGVFYTVYGVGFAVSGAVYGYLLDVGAVGVGAAYTLAAQIVALILLAAAARITGISPGAAP